MGHLYVLSSFGFKVEPDVGNNERFAPVGLLETCDLILDSWFDGYAERLEPIAV